MYQHFKSSTEEKGSFSMANVEPTLKKNDSAGKVISITKTTNADVLFARCTRELGRLGITIENAGADSDTLRFDLSGIPMAKRGMANSLLMNLMIRASRSVSHSEHQLTYFDLKQAAGLVHDVKQGDADAIKITECFDKVMDEARAKLGKELTKSAPKPAPKLKPKGKKTANNKSGSAGTGGGGKKGKKKAASLAPSSAAAE